MVSPSKHKLNTRINCIKVTRGEIWVHNTSLTLPLFFKVPVPRKKIEWSCSCVLGVSILPLSTIFLWDFGNVPTVWYFLFFYQILEMFRQYGIFCFSIRFWKCSDSMVFFVFLLDFRNVPTVWYFLFFYQILDMLRQYGIFCFSIRFWTCSDSMVGFFFILFLPFQIE